MKGVRYIVSKVNNYIAAPDMTQYREVYHGVNETD